MHPLCPFLLPPSLPLLLFLLSSLQQVQQCLGGVLSGRPLSRRPLLLALSTHDRTHKHVRVSTSRYSEAPRYPTSLRHNHENALCVSLTCVGAPPSTVGGRVQTLLPLPSRCSRLANTPRKAAHLHPQHNPHQESQDGIEIAGWASRLQTLGLIGLQIHESLDWHPKWSENDVSFLSRQFRQFHEMFHVM